MQSERNPSAASSRIAIVLGCLAVVGGGTASVATAASWRPVSPLSLPDRDAITPEVLMTPTGNVTAVWVGSGGAWSIKAATKPADAAGWSPQADVSVPGLDAITPKLRGDRAGNVIAMYRRSNGAHTVVQSAIRPGGVDAWANPQTASAPLQNAGSPDFEVADEGAISAVWHRFDGFTNVVQAAVRPPTGPWGTPVDLSAAGADATRPKIAIDANGNAIAVWQQTGAGGAITEVWASERSGATGAWSPAHPLSPATTHAVDPDVAMDAGGTGVAVWRRGTGTEAVVQSVVIPQGGAWSAPVDLSPTIGGRAEQIDLVSIPGAGVGAVWRLVSPTTSRIQAAVAVSGSWGSVVDLTGNDGTASEPRLAASKVGIVAVWRMQDGAGTRIQWAGAGPAGGWGTSTDVPGSAGLDPQHPVAGVDDGGNGVVVWSDTDGLGFRVKAAGLDASGPLLLGVVIPPEVNAGEPAEFLASAVDVWSGPVTAPAWTFGDGRTATGDRVEPVYRRPGRYTIGVQSSDATGAVTAVTRSIVVLPLRIRRFGIACPFPREPGICPAEVTVNLSHAATATFTFRSPQGKVFGKLTRKLDGGLITFDLPRRIGGKVLPVGRWRVSVDAVVRRVKSNRRTIVVNLV